MNLQYSKLSTRAKNVLYHIGINTYEELHTFDLKIIRRCRNCGAKTINEIKYFMEHETSNSIYDVSEMD